MPAEGAIATAAAPYFLTPAYGVDTPRVEGFSSLGGIPNLFDKRGNRIDSVVRRKPEITAPDGGGNTSFFIADIQQDVDTFPNFFGTSAAAPHAAGVAALMIEAQKLRTITPDQIRGILSTHTVDMDNPHTPGFDVGFDFKTGTGLIKADEAVETVRFPNVYIKSLQLEAICSDDPATTRAWKIINPNPFPVEVSWYLTGFLQRGRLTVPPGETTFTTRTAYYRNEPIPNVVVINWEDNLDIPRFDVAYNSGIACGKLADTKTNRASNVNLPNEALDVKTMDKVNAAEVYSNPSSSKFRVYLSFANLQNVDVELYSPDGRQIYKRMAPANGILDIDASNYKPGVYILRLRQQAFIKTFKLIKQ